MSYQQNGPSPYQQATYQAAPYQQQYAPRRPGAVLLGVGIVLVLLGIVAGGGIYVAGKEKFTSRVTSLVKDSGALAGCVTDLSVTKPGTYTLYYVSQGSLHLNGANDGCSNNDVVPIAADPNPPDIAMTLRNPDGKKLKMSTPTTTAVLKAGGVVATPYRQVNIGGIGDYELEIAMPDTGLPFAIGIGPKIEKSSSLLALVVGLFGVVFGIGCALLGAAQGGSGRRRHYAGGYPQYPQGYAPQTPMGPGASGQQGTAQRPAGPQQRPVQPGQPYPAQRPAPQPPVQRPPSAQPGQGPGGARPSQQPPVQRPGQRQAPAQPQQGPGQRPGGQRPGGQGPAQPGPATAAVPATTVQPQQSPPARPAGAPAAVPQTPQIPQGGGLPPIVSSQDESGSLSTAPPTQRMPGTPQTGPGARSGWERETPPPPTRPVSSQRPDAPTEPTEDLD